MSMRKVCARIAIGAAFASAALGAIPASASYWIMPDQQSSGQRQQELPGHDPALEATRCVRIENFGSPGSRGHSQYIVNRCGQVVEAFWCRVEDECPLSRGNTWTLAATGVPSSYPIAQGEHRFGACFGRNSGGFSGGNGNRFVICTGGTQRAGSGASSAGGSAPVRPAPSTRSSPPVQPNLSQTRTIGTPRAPSQSAPPPLSFVEAEARFRVECASEIELSLSRFVGEGRRNAEIGTREMFRETMNDAARMNDAEWSASIQYARDYVRETPGEAKLLCAGLLAQRLVRR